MNRPARIVIAGAGFGGVYAYLQLHRKLHGTGRMHVTLVSDNDTFTFIPMIHEVATGLLAPASITQSLRTIPQCCLKDFVEGKVTAVDADRKTVTVHRTRLLGEGKTGLVPQSEVTELPYDYLVLGIGSETNFFGVPGASEYSLELKDFADARRLKNTVIDSFERAQQIADPEAQREALRFVIVGGGPTGVEIAGELADLITKEMRDAFPDVAPLASIIIVDRNRVLLKGVDEWFGRMAERILDRKAGVYVMHNTTAERVTPEGVGTSSGFVRAGCVIWAAGVKAREIDIRASQTVVFEERTRRIKVNEYLELPGYPGVFVVGDMAWIADQESGQPYPMRAQFAVREGKTAGRNIIRRIHGAPLEVFAWEDRGFIVSLGKGGALAELFGIRFRGFVAWWVYRMAYLFSIVGLRARLRTGLEWTLNFFLPRDISKL